MQYCEDELLARAEECDDELALRRLEDQAKFARSYGTRHVAERYDEIIAAARQHTLGICWFRNLCLHNW